MSDWAVRRYSCMSLAMFAGDKILDPSKLKRIADDILSTFKMKRKCHIGLKIF